MWHSLLMETPYTTNPNETFTSREHSDEFATEEINKNEVSEEIVAMYSKIEDDFSNVAEMLQFEREENARQKAEEDRELEQECDDHAYANPSYTSAAWQDVWQYDELEDGNDGEEEVY